MVLKKFRFPILIILGIAALYLFNKELGARAVEISTNSLAEMMSILPPVFIFLGLLDVWVPKETMVKYLGDHSGITGILISFFMGSAAAGPLYGAFPIAAVLMKKGAKFSNILIFIGAWSTTKIPMFMFEISSLGARFAITRLVVDIIGIIVIAYAIDRVLPKEDRSSIYAKASTF